MVLRHQVVEVLSDNIVLDVCRHSIGPIDERVAVAFGLAAKALDEELIYGLRRPSDAQSFAGVSVSLIPRAKTSSCSAL